MEEREQTKKMKELLEEYHELKRKVFKGQKFALVEDTPEQHRFDQLFQFFHPQFRKKSYVDPLSENQQE